LIAHAVGEQRAVIFDAHGRSGLSRGAKADSHPIAT
jgi:hypothetical protein